MSTVVNPLNHLLTFWYTLGMNKCLSKSFQEVKRSAPQPTIIGTLWSESTSSVCGWRIITRFGSCPIAHLWWSARKTNLVCIPQSLSKCAEWFHVRERSSAIVFGIKKYHQYLFGRRFTLLTDHRPLTLLLGYLCAGGVPPSTSGSSVVAYQYDIEYWASKDHANADALSRLPKRTVEEPNEWISRLIKWIAFKRSEHQLQRRTSARTHHSFARDVQHFARLASRG